MSAGGHLALAAATQPAQGGSQLLLLVLLGLLVVNALVVVLVLLSRYKRCPANKALVIYGKTETGRPKCLLGGAAFVWPMIQGYGYLNLAPVIVPVELADAPSQDGRAVSVSATVTAAVGTQDETLQAAASRLLNLSPEQIASQVREIAVTQIRGAATATPAEQIARDRAGLAARVREAMSAPLASMGLGLLGVDLRNVT